VFYNQQSLDPKGLDKVSYFVSNVFNFVQTRVTDCSSKGTEIRRIRNPFAAIVVPACGSFLDRVRIFNEELDKLRLEALRSRGPTDWKPIAPHQEIKLIFTSNDDFLLLLGNYSQLQLVMLTWVTSAGIGRNYNSLIDKSNLLIQNYYEWTADDPLCTWIETPGTIKMKYDVTYNRTCYRDLKRSIHPQSLNTLVLNAKPISSAHYWPNDGNAFPPHFYTEQPPFAFYLYIIRDGIVTGNSEVYSGNMKLVQYACSPNIDTQPPSNVDQIPMYDEIFSIAQFWGAANFHRMVEIIPRLSLYLDFLKRNPNIKILASETGGRTAELITILGLNKSRLVSGTFRAKLIYLPRSSMCGFANVQEIQVLSMKYREYITENFPPEPRNKITLIRRSGSRRFTEQEKIEKVVEAAAKTYNLNYVMFVDNPVPSLNDTMRMFHSAVLVVAPHGAGLANVVFSQPGTYVIEGVCNLPHVNFCFQRLAYVLGHHWHGVPSRGGCEDLVDVSAEGIGRALASYLDQLSM